jgi:asparagine N-glycosylation enzyme membrane subunit Stt3
MSFVILSVGILTFATLSIMSKSQKLSIIHFLLAGLLLSYFVMTYGNIIIGTIVALVYVSMCSLLLLMTKHRLPVNTLPVKLLLPIIIGMLAALILVCSRLTVLPPISNAINQYTRIAGGITLLVTLLFVTVFTGISFLVMRRNSVTHKSSE